VLRRTLAWISVAAGITLIVILVTGGFRLDLGPVRVSAHRTTPPIAVLVIGALVLWRLGPSRAREALETISTGLSNGAPAVALVSAVSIAAVGLFFGTFAASSADPSAYVDHAALIDSGRLSFDEPLARAVDWHEPTWTFTPLGYRPGPTPGVIVLRFDEHAIAEPVALTDPRRCGSVRLRVPGCPLPDASWRALRHCRDVAEVEQGAWHILVEVTYRPPTSESQGTSGDFSGFFQEVGCEDSLRPVRSRSRHPATD